MKNVNKKHLIFVQIFIILSFPLTLCFGGMLPSGQPGKDLPQILLIGDSITFGYTETVRERLADKAVVHRIPKNARSTDLGVENIDEWLGDREWDLIHFNQGLHDLKIIETGTNKIPIDQYEKNLNLIVNRLKQTDAVLVWATITPVPDKLDLDKGPLRLPEDVNNYNQAAVRIMKGNSILINDLYTLVLPGLPDLQIPENVHYTPAGYHFLGETVAEFIEKHLVNSQ